MSGFTNSIFFFQQFDEDKNWIFNRAFSAQGHIHEGISYANSLGEVVQDQSNVAADPQYILVNQHLYDYSGRKRIDFLPAPVAQDHLQYKDQLIRTASGNKYSAADFDGPTTYDNPQQVTQGELANYYSNNNPDLTIPSADGYPFRQQHFYPDGRVFKTSQPGTTHRINGNHTRRFYYVAPSELELVRLFGDEAPNPNKVIKAITVDENGMMSGEYIGTNGLTLASFLMGGTEGTGLLNIDTSNIAVLNVPDYLEKGEAIQDYEVFASKEFFISQGNSITINYKNWRQQIIDGCNNFCVTCDYWVEISLRRSEDDELISKDTIVIPPVDCQGVNDTSKTLTVALSPQTAYIISKRVLSNTQNASGQKYLDGYISQIKNNAEQDFDARMQSIYQLLDTADVDAYNAHLREHYNLSFEATSGDSIAWVQTNCCGQVKLSLKKCLSISYADSLQNIEQKFVRIYNEYHPNPKTSITPFFPNVQAGELNAMVQNMLSAAYDYDPNKIWACFQGMAQQFDKLQTSLNQKNARYPNMQQKSMFDLLIDCLGRNIDCWVFAGNVAVEEAFHCVKYDWANRNSMCETYINETYCSGSGAFADTIALKSCLDSQADSVQLEFYRCINTSTSGVNLTQLGNLSTQLRNELRDTAYSNCELRRAEFQNMVIELYKKKNITLTETALQCKVAALVKLCQSNVDTCLLYLGDTSTATLAKEHLKRAMVYAYKIDIPPCTEAGNIAKGEQVELNQEYYAVRLLKALNKRLSAHKKQTVSNAGGTVTFAPFDVMPWLGDYDQALLQNFHCDPQVNPLPVHAQAKFETVGCELHYKYYNEEEGQYFDVIICTDICFPKITDCGDICVQYVEPEVPDLADSARVLTCSEMSIQSIKEELASAKKQCIALHRKAFIDEYQNTCINGLKDELRFDFKLMDYNHTLFYYDRKGKLVKTVAPKGVAYGSLGRNSHPNHDFQTVYTHDGFGEISEKRTPDGGEVRQITDRLGRVRFTQTGQQRLDGIYSFTKYDELNRIVEVGESDEGGLFFWQKADEADFPTYGWDRIYTIYNEVDPSAIFVDGRTQRYTQNKVSAQYNDNGAWDYYSYDAHGNVEWVIKDIPVMWQRVYIALEYDLRSKKVTKVKYNEGFKDQFFHRISYNANHQITRVETSRDGKIWDRDAAYEYTLIGNLSRVEIGEDKVQGLDYISTIQGWIKGINHPSLEVDNDPGKDGGASPVAKDIWGMSLNFFDGDFKRSFQNTASAFNSGGLKASHDLYDGTPTAWESHIGANRGLQYEQRTGYAFRYDALYQLRQADFKWNTGNSWNANGDYNTSYSYDLNGNFTSLQRNGFDISGSFQNMDNIVYNYQPRTNRIDHVSDQVSQNDYFVDLDNQPDGNYQYDVDGRLISDSTGGISRIYWNWQNKVRAVEKSNGDWIEYLYDAAGNRIVKSYHPAFGDFQETYYVPDHTGAVAAVYQLTGGDNPSLRLKEQHIYGREKLGVALPDLDMWDFTVDPLLYYKREVGKKAYALADHLGNTRTTISDIKVKGSITDTTHFSAELLSYHNYYPFGMEQIGRVYNSSDYRYGFNGMEKDDEWKNLAGTHYDFGARMYDSRLGRWLSRDPLEDKYAGKSPYNFVLNSPIDKIDPDGKDVMIVIWRTKYKRGRYPYGHAGIAVSEYKNGKKTGKFTYYELFPAKGEDPSSGAGKRYVFWGDYVVNSVKPEYRKKRNASYQDIANGYTTKVRRNSRNVNNLSVPKPDAILYLRTGEKADKNARKVLDAMIKKKVKYNAIKHNCTDLVQIGASTALNKKIDFDEKKGSMKFTTPNTFYLKAAGKEGKKLGFKVYRKSYKIKKGSYDTYQGK